jgi:hypothetical protein
VVRLQQVEEASKSFGASQETMVAKIDGMFMMLAPLNSRSDPSTTTTTPSPPPPIHQTLTPEFAFLKKQEVAG